MKKHTGRVSTGIIKSVVIAVLISALIGVGLAAAFPQKVEAQTVRTCLNRVNIPVDELHWVYVPESPDELYTEEQFFFLAGQLISDGVVDASDCPSGGLMLNGYANACGMARAMTAVTEIQNMLNESILAAYDNVGVPPVLLKQLISTESQYWPSVEDNSHYGYGHITPIGMLNALQWNSDLYAKVCPATAAGDCATNYSIANQILVSLVDTCETCEYGIDPDAVSRSVDVLAEVLLGFCFQTEQLVFNATGWRSNLVVDYATIWKLTLMSYNAGSQCVYDAIASSFEVTQGPIDWSHISAYTSGAQCLRGVHYADQITTQYFDFPPND